MAGKLEKHRTKFHAEATAIRNDLVEFQRKLAAQQHVNATTRRRALSQAHEQATVLMQGVKARYDAALQDEMRSLRRKMWSLPEADTASAFAKLSYRDAVSRAMAVKDPDDALELLDIAEESGDVHLVRALGLIGERKAWGPAVHQRLYDSDERLAKLMDEHDELEHAATNLAERIKDAAMFATPQPGSPEPPQAPDLAADWRDQPIAVAEPAQAPV